MFKPANSRHAHTTFTFAKQWCILRSQMKNALEVDSSQKCWDGWNGTAMRYTDSCEPTESSLSREIILVLARLSFHYIQFLHSISTHLVSIGTQVWSTFDMVNQFA